MPDSALATFTDPDAYRAALRDVRAQGVVTARGNFHAELATVRLDRLSLQRTQVKSTSNHIFRGRSEAVRYYLPHLRGPPNTHKWPRREYSSPPELCAGHPQKSAWGPGRVRQSASGRG
jgi:hypothetical protein